METTNRNDILKLYESLRLADVRDGMDWNMMHHYGSMSEKIRPLFRTKAFGIAKTVRYLPFQGPVPKLTQEEYTNWSGWYYGNVCTYPWMKDIEEGDFIVIDQSGVDVGLMGSNNALEAYKFGARGFISNGGVRDTDELILQKIPFWSARSSHGMVQGRLQFDNSGMPIAVGGVVVYQGDIIVADGDGVIVVPRKIAKDVAEFALKELESDKKSRRKLYDDLGKEYDNTVI